MTLHQYPQIFPNGRCRRSSQFTDKSYNIPDCKKEGEDLPYSGGYHTLVIQIYCVRVKFDNADMVAGKDGLLW
jgi:hypothetical protein